MSVSISVSQSISDMHATKCVIGIKNKIQEFFRYIYGKMDQQKLIYMRNNKISNLMNNIKQLEQQNLELTHMK